MTRRAVLALLAVAVVAGAAALALLASGGPGPSAPATTDVPGNAPPPAERVSAPRSPRPRAAPPARAGTAPESPAGAAGAAGATGAKAPVRTISGRLRSASGEPVGGVTVRVFDKRGVLVYATRSGDDGAFLAPDVPAMRLTVVAASSLRGERSTLDARVTVDPKDEGAIEVVVPDGAVASGRVVGPDGAGVPEAQVSVSTRSSEAPFAHAWTDTAGKFAVVVPKDAPTSLVADATTLGVSGRRWALGFADVPPGGADGIEVRCAEGKKVEGRVVDGAGRPLSGVRLRFAVQISKYPTFATSREDGTITCGGVDAQVLDVRLDPADTARSGLVLSPETVQPGAPDRVMFRLTEPTTARGRILDGSGAPVAKWSLTVTALDGGIERHPKTDAEGRFALDRVPPGRYRVRVTWVPSHERERTHVVGEVDAGAPEVVLTFPETIVR